MATHSSVLAWEIPGTGEPGGLQSMGSHRVGHDWSDLAAAAAAYGFHPEKGASTTALWASWAGSFLVGPILCIVECLFSSITGLYPLDAGSNTHTPHPCSWQILAKNVSWEHNAPGGKPQVHRHRPGTLTWKGDEESQSSWLFILPFYSFNQSHLLLHEIKKSSRQPLYRKRSNYFQQISPKIQRTAAVTEEAICDRHIITYD